MKNTLKNTVRKLGRNAKRTVRSLGLAGLLLGATAPIFSPRSACAQDTVNSSYSQASLQIAPQKAKYHPVLVTGREKQRVRDKLEIQEYLASEDFEAKKVEFTPGRTSYLITFPKVCGEELLDKGFPKAVSYDEYTLYFPSTMETESEWLYGILHIDENKFKSEAEKQYVRLAKKEFKDHPYKDNEKAFIEDQMSLENESGFFARVRLHENSHEERKGDKTVEVESIDEEVTAKLETLAQTRRAYEEFGLEILSASRDDCEETKAAKTVIEEYAKHGIYPYSDPTREQIRQTASEILTERDQAKRDREATEATEKLLEAVRKVRIINGKVYKGE